MSDARDAQQRASEQVDRQRQLQHDTERLVEGLASDNDDVADEHARALSSMTPSPREAAHVKAMSADDQPRSSPEK